MSLLPQDGEVTYLPNIFNSTESELFYNILLERIDWKHDQAMIFGKKIVTKRKVAWYGDKNFSYTYSKITKTAKIWTTDLRKIKKQIESVTSENFNSCLLNLYHNGSEGMAWHSDGEKELKKHGVIASVTFGAMRKFSFKHKVTKEKIDVNLESGSLLIMKGCTQDYWQHRLPPTKKVNHSRVNLTFRQMNL